MRAPLLAVAVAGAGCGDDAADVRDERSGARLRIARWHYDGGARELAGLYDAERSEPCAPRRWSDGATYCTPEAGEAVFVDAACGSVVGRVASGRAAPAYVVREYHVAGAPLASRLYRAGAATAPPQQRFELHDGACIGPYPVAGSYDYYLAGAEVTGLARIRHVTEAPRGRFAIEYATSDDGLRLPAGLVDVALDEPCEIAEVPDQPATMCLPRAAAPIPYYADAACTEPVIAASDPPSLGYVADPASECRSYYRIGAAIVPPALFERLGGGCVGAAQPGGTQLYAAADPIGLAPIPRVARGAGRLREIALGDLPVADALLADTELAADCRGADVASEHRCVPAAAARVESWFADAACQTPIAVAMVSTGACAVRPAHARAGDAYHPILAAHTPPLYELEPGDRCGSYQPPAPLVAYTIGPALPPAVFVGATLVID